MQADLEEAGVPGPDLGGRLLIEIEQWDGTLHVGLGSPHMPPENLFQGGLAYVRGFEIRGHVLAPPAYSGRAMRTWIMPIGPAITFATDGLDDVGQFRDQAPAQHGEGLSLTLLLPEAGLPYAAICLQTVWKYLHVWLFDDDGEEASVRAFSFSRDVHENLKPWIAGV